MEHHHVDHKFGKLKGDVETYEQWEGKEFCRGCISTSLPIDGRTQIPYRR